MVAVGALTNPLMPFSKWHSPASIVVTNELKDATNRVKCIVSIN